MQRHVWSISVVLVVAAGCAQWEDRTPTADGAFDAGESTAPPFERSGPDGGLRTAGLTPRPLPTPIVRAADPPPPISGGTLLAIDDGSRVLASDPDRDVVWLATAYHEGERDVDPADPLGRTWVNYSAGSIVGSIALRPGDEPGRLLDAGDRGIWVVLRRGGGIARLDTADLSVVERRDVCATPRGLAYHPGLDALLVACVQGGLRVLPFDGSPPRIVDIGDDLRDVVVTDRATFVSKFRSAHVLELDPALAGVTRTIEPTALLMGSEPSVAWRMVPDQAGGVLLAHQISASVGVEVAVDDPGGYGGDGSGCTNGIVTSAITQIPPSGGARTALVLGSVLPVDVAASKTTAEVALVSAGIRNDGTDRAAAVADMPLDGLFDGRGIICGPDGRVVPEGAQAVAATFDDRGSLIIQTRDPWRLVTAEGEIDLPGPSRKDTGHDLFHEDAGSGIACASCHAEGGEDGRVWTFGGIGQRRTQDLRHGLIGTEPFHWSGDMATFSMLAHEVFEKRMGGPALPPDYAQVLLEWIDHQSLPAREVSADAAVARGRALFESREIGCTGCHTGAQLGNTASFEVRPGEGPFQVPSLLGVSLRAPYMHDGCAASLTERFGPCGGTAHGNTAGLSPGQVSDLVAYLRTL